MSLAIPPASAVESARFVFPAAVAAGMIASGQLAGLSVPASTAWSSLIATASASASRTSAQIGKPESSITASGTGTIAATSSAISSASAQTSSVVCFKPVSPPTQYACASAESTGWLNTLLDIRTLRQSCNAADSWATSLMISVAVSGGISTSASVRPVKLS
jgi:hypothetical protein